MPLAYYDLLGHVIAAEHGFHGSPELVSALKNAGMEQKQIEQTGELAERGQELVERKLEEVGEDRIVEHSVHASTSELEMWLQTVEFQIKKNLDDQALIDAALARDVHADDHTASSIARTMLVIAAIRTDERVSEPLGGRKKVRDLLTRGWTFSKRLFATNEIRLEDGREESDSLIFEEIDEHRQKMTQWLATLDQAARGVAESNQRLLGALGYVPDDVGIPVGGTSYAVVLHERGQTEPPDPSKAHPCTQWSVGRQGRNRENLGKGWIEDGPRETTP